MLYNIRLIDLAGENGVSDYGVLMYVNFIFIAVFIGFSVGTAPIVGYHHGADSREELKSLFKKSLIILSTVSVFMFVLAEVFAVPLSSIFVGYDDELMEMTVSAFRICSFMFIFCGINIFGSAFFTALNNGFISALISFGRTLVFQVICVLLLPQFFGLSGLWLSVVIADALSLLVTIICLIKYRDLLYFDIVDRQTAGRRQTRIFRVFLSARYKLASVVKSDRKQLSKNEAAPCTILIQGAVFFNYPYFCKTSD